MADKQPDIRGDYLDERGVLITAAGRERVRRQLAELDAKWTPEEREQRRLSCWPESPPRDRRAARPDTSAVLAYASGSTGLGELLGEVAEEKHRFAVPAMCLVEAGIRPDEASWPMLDMLAGHPAAVVVGLDAAAWKNHASAAALFGGAGAGAAALLVAQAQAWYGATQHPDVYGDGIDTVLIED